MSTEISPAAREAALDELRDEGRFSVGHHVQQLLDSTNAALTKERDVILAERDRAIRSELELREEVSSTFRKHGLAAGPRAVEALVEQRDSAQARLAESEARVADMDALLKDQGFRETFNAAIANFLRAQSSALTLEERMELNRKVNARWAPARATQPEAQP